MVEWNIPFTLTSPYGDLDLSGTSGYKFDPAKCSGGPPLRQTKDDIPQGQGSIVHREFRSGYELRIGLLFMLDVDQPACAADLREMWEELQKHLFALQDSEGGLNASNALVAWTPTGADDRALENVRLLEELKSEVDGAITGATFALHSPLPYEVELTGTTTEIADGATETITNPGNVPMYPSVRALGSFSAMTYSNDTTGLLMSYDDSFPGAVAVGGGDHAFFGHFANNVYKNGDEGNLSAGVDVQVSDYFPLMPGDNDITADGCDLEVIWQGAWI